MNPPWWQSLSLLQSAPHVFADAEARRVDAINFDGMVNLFRVIFVFACFLVLSIVLFARFVREEG